VIRRFKIVFLIFVTFVGAGGALATALDQIVGETASMLCGFVLFAASIVVLWRKSARITADHSKLPMDWQQRRM